MKWITDKVKNWLGITALEKSNVELEERIRLIQIDAIKRFKL